jgi:hypothetical protein
MQTYGGVEEQLPTLLTSALAEMSGQLHALATLSPGKEPPIHWTGGWVGPRAGLDMVTKIKIP